MINKRAYFLLFLIVLIGFSLRFYRLHLNLPELYIDETTGQYLMRLSVIHPELNLNSQFQRLLYNTLSFTIFFGLNPFGARSAAAFFSSLIPICIFLFFKQIKHPRSTIIALTGAFIAAILPWTFMIGRIGHVHIPIIVSLSCLSGYFFLKAKHLQHYFYSLLCLGAAAFYYPSIIFVAPFMASLILYFASENLNKKQKNQLFLAISSLGIMILVIFIFKYQGFNLRSRGIDLGIWRDPNTIHDINRYRGNSWLSESGVFTFLLEPKIVSPFLYNKLTANLAIFTRNYLSFFSPDWLFLRGDPILRHSTGQIGYFYPILLPFFLYGLFRFFKIANKKTILLFLTWIFASPLTAALTKDGSGYLLRAVTMLPFFTYFLSLGVIESFDFLKTGITKFIYGILISFLILYSAFYFFFGYFHVYPYETTTARAYEYGFKDLSDFQVSHNNSSLLIIWDGYYPYSHFHFWQNISAAEYSQYKFEDIVIGQSHFYHPSSNLYFVKPFESNDVEEFISKYKPDYLVLPDRYYVQYPSDLIDKNKILLKVINYPNGDPNFSIYEIK